MNHNKDLREQEIQKKTDSLKKSYSFIIKIDLEKGTAECIHKTTDRSVGISYEVVLTLESANDYFLNNFVMPEDRKRVEQFFARIMALKDLEDSEALEEDLQAVYSFQFRDGEIRKYGASVVFLDKRNVLLCGRDITDARSAHELIAMSRILKKLWNHCNSTLSALGMEGFTLEISEKKIYPLFLSKRVCQRMQISEKALREITENGISMAEFCSRLGMNQSSLNAILNRETEVVSLSAENGLKNEYYVQVFSSEVGLDVFTVVLSKERIDKTLAPLIVPSEELPKPEKTASVDNKMFIPGNNSRIWIRTFGNFDVFVNGVPIRFTSAKAKELLAVLVDRRGGSLTAEEAIAYLWEDKPTDKQVMSNYRKVAMKMHETLDEYGIGELVINHKGIRSLNMAVVDCDLYRFLIKDKTNTDLFHGQYMQNYSWGEATLATICRMAEAMEG